LLIRFTVWRKDSVIVKLKDVQNQIKEIKKIDGGLKIADKDIEDSFITLQEAALALRDYRQSFFDAQRLAVIDERLELLNRLKRKHGGFSGRSSAPEAGNRR